MGSAPAASVTPWWLGFAAATALAHLVWPTGVAGDVTYHLATVGAGVLACVLVLRRPRGTRLKVGFIAAGVAASGFADVLYLGVTARDGSQPDVSIADVPWLLSYVCLIVAVLGPSTFRRGRRGIDVDGAIDLVTYVVVAVVVVAQSGSFAAILEDGSVPIGVRAVWAAYPILDAVLLACVARAITVGHWRNRTGGALVAGVACWLFADLGFLLGAGADDSRWLDVGWMLGACLIAQAVVRSPRVDDSALPPPKPVRRGRVALTLVPVLVPRAVEVGARLQGRDVSLALLTGATVVLLLCAYLRASRLVQARDVHQRNLTEREHYYRVLSDNASDAVIVIDEHGRIRHDAPQLATMLGRPGLGTAGSDVLALVPPDERERMTASLHRLWVTPGARSETEIDVQHADGEIRWFHLRAVNLRDDPAIGGIVINLAEVTRRKQMEDELTHRAFHDSLTSLPNRALFQDRVEQALIRTARSDRGTAVIFLDVDGFKAANDKFGHGVGDRLLRDVADRLTEAVRASDTVARLGGDEFAILVENATQPLEEAKAIADRVLHSMSRTFDLPEQRLALSASLGIAVADATSTGTTLLRDADIAMYRSKANGKSRWTVYDEDMRDAALERMELELDLEGALLAGQFRLAYHPIVRLETEDVVGFEALLRWHHPTRGELVPDSFIPIAEATGMIVALGEWVLQEACRTAAAWQDAYPRLRPSMAVNLSARQLSDPSIVRQVASALERSGLDPSSLVLEMTETVLVEDPVVAAARLHALRQLGVRLAIDDFGTGYSSLSYLRQFPVDILKIDRSFINTITDRRQVPAIVRGLLDLGRTLELETIAEGIEANTQLASLRDEQCQYGQGYLFAQPLDRERAEQFIRQLQSTGDRNG